eukprot:CAMPEP_0206574754 /NCGR_PEP_ID=MMETSP0325_2-20121206/29651_1 /ASSEMBLY_ACC=CAM_ASM_000347 /TAXON_ID=2866 /ORGANISM="Crypthecodinium cohnii, Strain Seligo" /LENGTH=81 /DNA_ID=CAMNT_0054079453 /DNA_START=1037 /DNA_END=1282 /DNA_ORIENTATION=-
MTSGVLLRELHNHCDDDQGDQHQNCLCSEPLEGGSPGPQGQSEERPHESGKCHGNDVKLVDGRGYVSRQEDEKGNPPPGRE